MSLRLIAGEFSGRVIKTPSGSLTHPMSERVRGSLFNIIGDEVHGAKVLDAFAGSGALGIESLSRGAKEAFFVDSNQAAYDSICENVKLLKLQHYTHILKQKVGTFIRENPDVKFDLIFSDAPYDNAQLSTVFLLGKLLKINGLMVVSYVGRGEIPQVNEVVVVDNRSYGRANLAFYRRTS